MKIHTPKIKTRSAILFQLMKTISAQYSLVSHQLECNYNLFKWFAMLISAIIHQLLSDKHRLNQFDSVFILKYPDWVKTAQVKIVQ